MIKVELLEVGNLDYDTDEKNEIYYKDKKVKVLIVDDENLAISRLQRLLNDEGIENITSFTNPQDALKECIKTKFDVVFFRYFYA